VSNECICHLHRYRSNPASLILGKVYRTLPDAEPEARNMLRIIDKDTSEPDCYLYPASMFAPIELPEMARRALMAAGAEPMRPPMRRRAATSVTDQHGLARHKERHQQRGAGG
jgi:hypothetical protein